ncbi:MAG: hypothetical protein MUF49_00800 [Oculatellaceae cyanobacterium Prado106]|jgi:predicted transposase YbfD/YdcC|nr:hypothetical protein [Oculatellaceae cyanobacterium Prado106]
MSNFPHHIIPTPQAEFEEVFSVYETTQAFYHEVQAREAFEEHCRWYHQVAAQNRSDLAKMQSELNIMQWFSRKRR